MVNAAYAVTIFLSAFLLFQIQPLMAKIIVPWFGGTAAVWSTCLLFFQATLLLGYLYTHWLSRSLSPKHQSLLHLLILALSISVLPIYPDSGWKPSNHDDPALLILLVLAASIGLPYFMLSTTGPLIQSWFSRENGGRLPYRLFALSNAGSMLGLLSYPFIFEPIWGVTDLASVWSFAYLGFVLLYGLLAWRGRWLLPLKASNEATTREVEIYPRLLWIALAACPTILLMSVTSHLTQDVAPMPFLWVLPLALYLLSFILCFESQRWYQRKWYIPLMGVSLATMMAGLLTGLTLQGVWLPVATYSLGLFVFCMVCHGELARLKPSAQHLTLFYVLISAGGALGGAFVALLAPLVFNANYELPIGIITSTMIVLFVLHREAKRKNSQDSRVFTRRTTLAGIALITVSIVIAWRAAVYLGDQRLMARNFYGALVVRDEGVPAGSRRLYHGIILHGDQFLDPGKRRWPTTYYGEESGAGRAILATRGSGAQHVGIIGLGAGSLASYGRKGDHYRIYEINPLVVDIARTEFSYLRESPAETKVILGDARLSLERELPQQFDVLLVDAFSGDAIPVHLLTLEAFKVYFRHIKPGGILAIHISNRNLDLRPVIKVASEHFGRHARLVSNESNPARGVTRSHWILVAAQPDIFRAAVLQSAARVIGATTDMAAWTDNYSSILKVLK